MAPFPVEKVLLHCTVGIFATFFPCRKLRYDQRVQLVYHNCLALIVFLVVYLVSVFTRGHYTACLVMSALFHYTFLVALLTMVTESVYFFLLAKTEKLVRCYLAISVIVSWGTFASKTDVKLHVTLIFFHCSVPFAVDWIFLCS